jgi:ribosomal protein S18 acetylase RimI-like enzyme
LYIKAAREGNDTLVAMEFLNVAENLRESFRTVARHRDGGEVRELPGVSIASAGVAFQMFNAAFFSSPVTSEAELARRILLASTHFGARGQEWACWVCEGWLDRTSRRKARQMFLHHGLRHSVDLPGMQADGLLPPARRLPQLDLRRVFDAGTRNDFCAIGSLCFNVPLAWFREVFDNNEVWTNFEAWIGYLHGEPVSTAAVVAGSGALGVYNVATVPGHQRRGYAEAVMRAALDDARRRHGLERSILQSTPAGQRLYQRMGYRTVTKVSVYAS